MQKYAILHNSFLFESGCKILSLDQFLMTYVTDSKRAIFKEEKPHILLPSQQKLITDILIIVLINSFKLSQP